MSGDDKLISINEALEGGIDRLRKQIWAQPEDHIKIDIITPGKLGPWIHLYSPFNEECNGRDPVSILFVEFDLDEKLYQPYTGPLPGSNEYRERVMAEDAEIRKERSGV